MTTNTIRTAPPTSQPNGPAGAPHPGGPPRRHRRTVTGLVVTGAALVAVAAAGTGVLLGQRATGPAAPTVGTTVTFSSDWQVYRAGERGDVAVSPLPGDWTTYRAGERTPTSSSSGHASDWTSYRDGER